MVSGSAAAETPDRFEAILEEARLEKIKNNNFFAAEKPNTLQVFQQQVMPLPPADKVAFLLDCIAKIHRWGKGRRSFASDDPQYQLYNLRNGFLHYLLKTKLDFAESDWAKIGQAFLACSPHRSSFLYSWPINLFLNQVQKNCKEKEVSDLLREVLTKIKSEVSKESDYSQDKEKIKVCAKIDALLHLPGNGTGAIKPEKFLGKDLFSAYANPWIQNANPEDQVHLYKILLHVRGSSAAKPSAKFLSVGKNLVQDWGREKFKEAVLDWFRYVIGLKEDIKENTSTYNGTVYSFTTFEFLSGPNSDALKGLVWMSLAIQDSEVFRTLAALAERVYRKIPGHGPAAAGLGNACLYVLSRVEGMEGVGHLSRLKLRIKQNNTQTLIQKYLLEAAKAQGVSVHEIEDLAVEDFGLTAGKRAFEAAGFTAVLEVVAVGKTELKWLRPDGTPQKTVPAQVKETQAPLLKEIKDTAKQIELSLSVQRDRLDRQFKTSRQFSWEYFNRHYFSHGLMAFMARKIIWSFISGDHHTAGLYYNGHWINCRGEVFVPEAACQVALWHPVNASLEEIRLWRQLLLAYTILQPFKQAYREVYLLTDAELNTRTYSNRMAAHLLKQHQFNSLAKTRGWKYSLLGWYDDGRNNDSASVVLPDFNLRAEFWVNEVNADAAYNDAGIWHYVSTDQVRFLDLQSNEVVELVAVPQVLFSEIMRDVDLFVGVASVGNDQNWQDNGGLLPYRDYWQAYSFGELGEIAKTRREILESLLPRLKVAKVSEIKDRFLVVKGKLRTYKIHLGSTNILMEPNDQYLCIVADSSKKNATEHVFLPFEGDTGLSIILSKAFLLAEDDKIADTTITSQILRK
ncbi:MAG: DUF4132 domain-containing protein [Adhaeribacter sp.]